MIPALTVRQPSASAFFTRPENVAKDIENRTWSVNYREQFEVSEVTQ